MPGNTEQQAQATSRADKQSAVRRYVVPRSAAISIEVYDLGAGPAIVLLPSLGRGATDMLELAEPLAAAGYRVLCPEPRGNGRSFGPLADKTLHDWAGDIAAVIEHAGKAPVVIVGHAHGNWIARTVASDRPDLVRALVLTIREQPYIEAAVSVGTRVPSILMRHILPNLFAPLMVQATFIAASAILTEAVLSFLGVGIPPHIPSWGNIMAEGRNFVAVAFHIILYPGLFLGVAVLAVNLVGDGLRDMLDPRLAKKL